VPRFGWRAHLARTLREDHREARWRDAGTLLLPLARRAISKRLLPPFLPVPTVSLDIYVCSSANVRLRDLQVRVGRLVCGSIQAPLSPSRCLSTRCVPFTVSIFFCYCTALRRRYSLAPRRLLDASLHRAACVPNDGTWFVTAGFGPVHRSSTTGVFSTGMDWNV